MSTSRYRTLADAQLQDKRVLVRAGFDVPIENGKVVDQTRIEALMPTMKHILDAGAILILMAHQGRPKGIDPVFSQKPLVPVLQSLLGATVHFAEDCIGEKAQTVINRAKQGDVVLLENLRFHPEEKANDAAFARKLADLAHIYVNDAFTNCHRDHASMVGVTQHLPSFMGLALEEEIAHLSLLMDPKRPLTLIVSGAKMETKVPVIERFLSVGNDVLLGGCIANTFIKACGFPIGATKCYEPDYIETAQKLMLESKKQGNAVIHVPSDAILASAPNEAGEKIDVPLQDIAGNMQIFDIGSITVKHYIAILEQSATVVWNGPLGLSEFDRFSHGTRRIAEAVAAATRRGAVTILGGGDTIDFHERYGYPLDAYTFVSMGGGAMLEFISGKKFASLTALEK